MLSIINNTIDIVNQLINDANDAKENNIVLKLYLKKKKKLNMMNIHHW